MTDYNFDINLNRRGSEIFAEGHNDRKIMAPATKILMGHIPIPQMLDVM
jgi:hypothetical protein